MKFTREREGEKEKNGHFCVKEWYEEDNLDVTWKGLTDLSVIPSSSNMLQWELFYVISAVETGIESVVTHCRQQSSSHF